MQLKCTKKICTLTLTEDKTKGKSINTVSDESFRIISSSFLNFENCPYHLEKVRICQKNDFPLIILMTTNKTAERERNEAKMTVMFKYIEKRGKIESKGWRKEF